MEMHRYDASKTDLINLNVNSVRKKKKNSGAIFRSCLSESNVNERGGDFNIDATIASAPIDFLERNGILF